MAKADVTAQRLREILVYCQDTGLFRWRAYGGVPAGSDSGDGYIRIGVDGRLYFAQRLAWLYVNGQWPENDVDHINGQRADNRLCNLRRATRSQNNINAVRPKDNTSGYKGVMASRGKWLARIGVNRKKVFLGRFDSIEDAAQAYADAANRYYPGFSMKS